jgi:hypothetical protein
MAKTSGSGARDAGECRATPRRRKTAFRIGDCPFPYSGSKVDQRTFEAALDFLVLIEPDPELFADECARKGFDDRAEYEKIVSTNAASIDAAHAALRQYGQQIGRSRRRRRRPCASSSTKSPGYPSIRRPRRRVGDCLEAAARLARRERLAGLRFEPESWPW